MIFDHLFYSRDYKVRKTFYKIPESLFKVDSTYVYSMLFN